jgi:hypothetical protein
MWCNRPHILQRRVPFEGVKRDYTPEEAALMETLVVESYNLLTRGDGDQEVGCVDAHLREMASATLIDQFFQEENGSDGSIIDRTFAWITCDG